MNDRRKFMQLTAVGGGAIFMSGLFGCAQTSGIGLTNSDDFYFVQLSDIHWGYSGANNPDAANTLKKTVATVNALDRAPDFIMFTGDLTHSTNDPIERRRRLTEFRDIVNKLNVKNLKFIPGEHDAAQDSGAAYKELFGATYYSFNHKGVHFITLDNVSDIGAGLGATQLEWLRADLATLAKDARIVVFTHRPLFDLAPKWDWATSDGAKAIDLIMPYQNVSVFYGHIHQEHHHMTGHIAHHAAKSLIFPLPSPGSQEKRTALPWDPAQPNKGLGFRGVSTDQKRVPQQADKYVISEFDVQKA